MQTMPSVKILLLSLLGASLGMNSAAWAAASDVKLPNAGATSIAPVVETEAQARLDGMARAFRELNYDMSFVYMRDGTAEPMRLVHALDDGRERERLVHLNGQPRELIREDDTVVAYFPDRPPLMLDKPQTPTLWTRALVNNLNQLHQHYQLLDRGDTRMAGRSARQLDVRSVDGKRYGYRLWIDNDSGLLLRSDLLDARDRLLEQWQVISLQVLDKVPAEALKVGFAVPAASVPVQVVKTKLVSESDGQSLAQVGWLPNGFILKSRSWKQTASTAVEHLLYSDGVAAISVYVGAPLPKNLAVSRFYRKGAMAIFEVGNAKAHVTVVGDVPATIAKQIALSVTRDPDNRANNPASASF